MGMGAVVELPGSITLAAEAALLGLIVAAGSEQQNRDALRRMSAQAVILLQSHMTSALLQEVLSCKTQSSTIFPPRILTRIKGRTSLFAHTIQTSSPKASNTRTLRLCVLFN